MPSSKVSPVTHHEQLEKSLDALFDAQRKLPDVEDENTMRLIIRKPWVTSVAEFILLRDAVDSMTQHAEQIRKEFAAVVDALREMAVAASVDAPELEAIGRAHGKAATTRTPR